MGKLFGLWSCMSDVKLEFKGMRAFKMGFNLNGFGMPKPITVNLTIPLFVLI
jgi:hypothetical protein